MDFGIWVEPEAVNEDSDLYRRHPEWALRPTGKPITEWRFQYVLNFAREDVCDYAWSYLDDLLSNNNIAYLKWDMNRYLCEVNWAEKPMDEEREVWTRFVYNVHKLFRRIQEKFPHVWLENCAGGGGRIDLGMTACSDMVNASDNTDPLDNLRIFEGYVPAQDRQSRRCARSRLCKRANRPLRVSRACLHAARLQSGRESAHPV